MAAGNQALLEARINQIVYLRNESAGDVYVASELCMPVSTVSAIEEAFKYAIHAAVARGDSSIIDVANELKMNSATVAAFLFCYEFSIKGFKTQELPYMDQETLIGRAKKAGAKSIDELVRLTGIPRGDVTAYTNGNKKSNPNAIENGAGSVDEIVTPPVDKVRKFGSLLQKISDDYSDDVWPFQKALEHEFVTKKSSNRTPFKTVLAIFEMYHEAEKEGKRLPLSYFASQFETSESVIDSIFKRVNVKPMFRTISMPSQEQMEAVLRLWETSLPISDIAYFANEYFGTNFSASTYFNILKKAGAGRKINKFKVGKNIMISNNLASIIYETVDAYKTLYGGFTLPQIEKEVGASKAQINATLEMRDILEPRIVGALRLLTGTNINTPYLDLLRYKAVDRAA